MNESTAQTQKNRAVTHRESMLVAVEGNGEAGGPQEGKGAGEWPQMHGQGMHACMYAHMCALMHMPSRTLIFL